MCDHGAQPPAPPLDADELDAALELEEVLEAELELVPPPIPPTPLDDEVVVTDVDEPDPVAVLPLVAAPVGGSSTPAAQDVADTRNRA